MTLYHLSLCLISKLQFKSLQTKTNFRGSNMFVYKESPCADIHISDLPKLHLKIPVLVKLWFIFTLFNIYLAEIHPE